MQLPWPVLRPSLSAQIIHAHFESNVPQTLRRSPKKPAHMHATLWASQLKVSVSLPFILIWHLLTVDRKPALLHTRSDQLWNVRVPLKRGCREERAGRLGNIWMWVKKHPSSLSLKRSVAYVDQLHLAAESRRRNSMTFNLKMNQCSVLLHIYIFQKAMHTLEYISIYNWVFTGGRQAGFSKELAPSRLQVPTTLCPTKPIPNLCLTSCQDHMTPQKTTNTTSSYAGIHQLQQLNYSEFPKPDSGQR